MYDYILLKKYLSFVDEVISFFLSRGIDNEKHKNFINRAKDLKQTSYRPWLDHGYFSKVDFYFWYLDKEKVVSLPESILDMILRLLCNKNLLYEMKWGEEIVYSDNTLLVNYFSEKNLLRNVIFGFSYSVSHFKESVFKIEHIDKNEDHAIGTGFYFAVRSQNGKIHSFIITNKHVVENAVKLNIYDENDTLYEFKDIVCSESRDLAIFILDKDLNLQSFNFNEEPNVLDEIMTMGYPSVPMTRDSYLLCHKGEINAFVKDYEGTNHILISAKTSAGNSGGPIIDFTGRLVGIVTKEFYDESQLISKGKLPYYAGITSSDIRNFLNDNVLPRLEL